MSTAYTQHSFNPTFTLSGSLCVAHLPSLIWYLLSSSPLQPCRALLCTFPERWVNQWIGSHLPARHPPNLLLLDWPPLNSPWIWFYSCISEFTLSRPPSVSLNSPDYSLPVRTIVASKCISKLAWSQPPDVSLSALNRHLKILLWLRSSTICTQINCMSVYHLWLKMNGILWWPRILLWL